MTTLRKLERAELERGLFAPDSDVTEDGAPSRRVLFLNRTYPPGGGETSRVLCDMALNLVQRGWAVTVLATSSAGEAEFLSGGVRVVRMGLPAGRSRLLRFLAGFYLYPALLVRALLLGRFDVVVTKSDPPGLLIFGTLLGFLLRARKVHWMDVLEAGFASRAPVGTFRLAALKLQDRIVAAGRCMSDRLQECGVPRSRIEVIPNWPHNALRPFEHRFNAYRAEAQLQGTFVVMHSGPVDRVESFEPLLLAAEEIKGAYPEVRFVIVGEGSAHKALAALVEELGLSNVQLPTIPAPASNVLSAGDLHVAVLEDEAWGLRVPDSAYGAMAVRRPCLFVGPSESEAALFVQEHGAGDVVSDAGGLALRIVGWYQNDVRRRVAGNRAYRAVRLLRANAMIEFDEMLDDLATLREGEAARPAELRWAA